MCGIYGMVGGMRQPDLGLNAIRRRGPDDRGVWSDEGAGVWLGHVRLSIIDPSSAGHQPMVSPDGRVVMIYNGELYNFKELRAGLEAEGEHFTGNSDSEVLLRLFAREGATSFSKLNGIFAAAFWERDRKILTLVRDPLGVKPLYLSCKDGRIAFASEMKALLEGGDAKPEIDTKALLHHLVYLWSPGRKTIVRDIEKLLPGEALEFGNGEIIGSWSYAGSAPSGGAIRAMTPKEGAALVARTVEDAVERQMVADVPLGAFLSGGLDSSAVVAFARRHCDARRLQCFSIEVTEGSTVSEGFAEDLPYAREVAGHLDVDLHVVRAGPEMMDRLEEMVYLLDEPTPDPAALNTLLIAEMARSQGIKVLLSGAGGDDIFTGYRRHVALAAERYWRGLPAFMRKGAAGVGSHLPSHPTILRRASKALRYAGLDSDKRLASYFFWASPEQARSLLSADAKQGLADADVFEPLLETLEELPDGIDPLERMLYLERRHFLADHNLNYTDKMGMAAGVEVRVPLLDREVVAMANRIPISLKQRGSIGKWIFKRAMEPYLPHNVIYRPKSGFGVPLRNWLHGQLRPIVEDLLSPSNLARRGLFDPVSVAKLVADDRAGRVDGAYAIFGLVCMELWCRRHVDG